jgi:hypothetical protein
VELAFAREQTWMSLSLEGDYVINGQVNVPLSLANVMAGCWPWPSGPALDDSADARELSQKRLHEDPCANHENC